MKIKLSESQAQALKHYMILHQILIWTKFGPMDIVSISSSSLVSTSKLEYLFLSPTFKERENFMSVYARILEDLIKNLNINFGKMIEMFALYKDHISKCYKYLIRRKLFCDSPLS